MALAPAPVPVVLLLPGRPPRNPPNRWVASLAGMPWDSRQLVNLARAAAKLPPLAEGAVVVEVEELDLVDPPHAPARAAMASSGATNRSLGVICAG